MTERPESDDRPQTPEAAHVPTPPAKPAKPAAPAAAPTQTPPAAAPSKPATPATPANVVPQATAGAVPAPAAPAAPAPSAPVVAPAQSAQSAPAQETAKPALATPESVARAKQHGRADENGTVYVTVDGEEHECGQFPNATEDEALAYFARKFDDAEAQVDLLEQRLAAKAPTTDMGKTVEHVRQQVAARGMVGDLAGLSARLDALDVAIGEAVAREKDEQQRAKTEQLAHRTAIVEAAETVAGQDPEKTQWKHSSERMGELFDQWKAHQRSGVRLSKSDEESLWKRFRKARTTFDRHRKAFFSKLDETNAKAKRAKEALIAEAESLSGSTDWGPTASKYRDLMDRWKASPRASRKDDDALWSRFRAAQDVFFDARKAANEQIDQEFEANLVVKEELLAQAKKILPVKNLDQAKKELAAVQARWEEAGKVPRAHLRRVESELRAVEDAVKKAEDDQWRRTDPETKARSNSMLTQLENKIADQKAAIEAARASGNEKKAANLEKDLATSEQWLHTLRASASELT